MDSGNSGSLQSSSGGDEEYDSRAESISAFLNQTTCIAPMSNPPPPQPPPPPPPHHHQPNSTMFDPLPNNYFDQLTNFDPVWSKTDPTYGSLFAASSPTVPFPPVSTVSDKTNDLVRTPGVRNPKKRSRASRRAPTTVLTTDTTNFRAMVQEFTGIPAPPFPSSSSSSPFTRNRLDLFGTPGSTRSYLLGDSSSHNPPPPPPYLLRPFAQKFQPPPFLSPNSNSRGPNSNSPINYQMQNQILTFQSLLQNPLANSSFLRSSESLEIPSSDSGRAVDEFGSSRDDNQTSWAGGVGVGSNGDPLRSVNGDYVDYSGSNLSIGKLNYEKGSDNVVGGRGEGMVETWISSSDH